MTGPRPTEYLVGLVRELVKLPDEAEWVEFKENNDNPEEIGQYISALANSAALLGKTAAYCLWGIEDGTHRIKGTAFRPEAARVGAEPIENWILRLLEPKIEFRFHEAPVDGERVVILEISRATKNPVAFKGIEYIRVGTQKKKLKEFPEKERDLWRVFDQHPFEEGVASERISTEQTLALLDYPSYFELLKIPVPETREAILAALKEDELIRPSEAGGWDIMNLGAVLFARRLDDFPRLGRKAVRVIVYRGNSRIETIREQVGTKGYASGFEEIISLISGLLPSNEVVEKAIRRTVPLYPDKALRELIPNALIHQDFFVTGAGPMVEIFDNRMEITNPGAPLVETARFIDTPPRSRNEDLASLMRRMGICEERGSGVDKVVFQTELHQLPPPIFEAPGDFTKAILLAPRPLQKMDKADRVRACYLHACLKFVNMDFLTNSSIRARFGISEENMATASRFIKEAVDEGAIKPFDENAGRKYAKYVPWWAGLKSDSPGSLI